MPGRSCLWDGVVYGYRVLIGVLGFGIFREV